MNEIVILGGPNGAGKTTAAKVLLPSLSLKPFSMPMNLRDNCHRAMLS